MASALLCVSEDGVKFGSVRRNNWQDSEQINLTPIALLGYLLRTTSIKS